MTEPTTEEPTAPTMTEFTPPVVEETEEVGFIAYAPGFLAASPHLGTPSVTIQWESPQEGRADSYLIEASNCEPAEVGGHVLGMTIEGLPEGSAFEVTVTAKTGENAGALSVRNLTIWASSEQTVQGA